jgi:hypothetical protein
MRLSAKVAVLGLARGSAKFESINVEIAPDHHLAVVANVGTGD